MTSNRGTRGAGRIFKPVADRVANMVARAVVQLINESTKLQEAQLEIQEGEFRDECERFQQYGFSSKPLPGAEAVVIFVGGSRDHPLITNVDDRRYRPTNLQDGEAIVYNHVGDFVHVKADGTIHVVASQSVVVDTPLVQINASTKVEITSPLVTMSGDLEVEGDITDRYSTDATTIHSLRETYNIHTHPENDNGGPTSPPIQQVPT